jgi:hypothetical protein
MISIIMLALCTFFEVRNGELVEVWKYALFTSFSYVAGIPLKAFFSNRRRRSISAIFDS